MTKRLLAGLLLGTVLSSGAWGASDTPVVVNGTSGQLQRVPSGDTLSYTGPWVIGSSAADSVHMGGGVANNGVAPVQINTNANSSIQSPVGTGFLLDLVGADNAGAIQLLDAYGTSPSRYITRAAGGTGASPTAMASGAAIFQLVGQGYDGSAYSGTGNASAFLINATASSLWTTSNHGTSVDFYNTKDGAITRTLLFRLDAVNNSMDIGGGGGTESFRVNVVSSAVDRVQCQGAATANPATVSCVAAGTDTNVNLQLAGLGSGAIILAESHLGSTQATLPTVSACGTGSPSVTTGSTDTRGSVTTGTTATSCTITFKGNAGAGFATAPFCLVGDNSLVISASVISASTTTLVIGLSGAGLTAGSVTWHCLQ